jgi:PhnB protein
MAVKPIPDGYHSVTPYLTVNGAEKLIDFVKQAFGAEELLRMPGPDGIGHAEVKIGNSIVMLGDAGTAGEPRPATLYLYVEDTDQTYKRAMEAGGTTLEEPSDQFYGDRRAAVIDPVGNQWFIATHVKDPTPEEMAQATQGS